MLFVLDPNHVKTMLLSAQHFDPNPFIHDQIMGALMGSPQAAIDYYNLPDTNTDYIQTTHIRQHTTGSNLGLLDKRMYHFLKQSIQQALDITAENEWKHVPDLYDFVIYHVTYAVAITLLGSSLLSDYPQLIADLWTHIEATPQFFMGLPRFAMPRAYAARDRLLSNIREYSVKSEELRKRNQVDTKWDPVAGSGLLQEREQMYSELPGHDHDGRSAQTLGLLYGGTSLVVPITFWYLFETLRDPKIHARVLSEIETHAIPKTETYNFMQLAACPLLQSMHAETTRLYSSNLTVRQVVSPVYNLDDKYTVAEGTKIFIANKFNGQFAAGWAQTRPEALARPLDVFWAERFLVSDNKGRDKRKHFSDVGLSGSWTSFGGGEHKCPGRHFARHIGIMALALLMGEYEIEMLDREGAAKMVPPLKNKAWGTMKPQGKVAARIRRRKA
jgi:cytochrome P450